MKTLSTIKIIFFVVGLGLLAAAGFWANSIRIFVNTAWTADGVVVDLLPVDSDGSTLYKPLVRFVTDRGQEVVFSTNSSSNPPGFSVGEKVEVFYQPANPTEAKINTVFQLWGGPLIIGGLGSIFFAIGFAMIMFAVVGKRRAAYLKENGARVDAKLNEIALNESLSVNGRHPFQIIAQWREPETGKVYVFRSGNLWFDPTDYIDRERISVFIEKGNPKKYLVDLSFLPEVVH